MKTIKLLLVLSFLAAFGTTLFSQTKTELQITELRKPITDYIAKNYTAYKIKKAFKVDAKGVITFDICIVKNDEYEKLIFDREGQFIKKESCCHECCQPAQKK